MGFLFATFRKDLARWRQDLVSISIWVGIPFMIGGLLTAMVDQDGGSGPMGTLVVADLDETLVSGFVGSAYSQGELANLIGVESVTEEEGLARVEAGEASGFLIIPKGFQDALLNDTPVTLTLKTNPSQSILPGIIQDVTEVLLDAGFYLQQVFGDEIKEIKDGEIPDSMVDAFVSGMAVRIQNKVEQLSDQLSPLLIDVEIVEPPPSEPKPNLGVLFLPGIVLMALMFAAQGLSADYWEERDTGTLRRLVSTSGLLSRFVLGKALAAAAVMIIIGGGPLLLGFAYHDLAWSKFLPSMLWIIAGGVGLFAWFAALQMLFASNKAANLITSILVFPLLMMGGSFFPLDILPDWLASIGRLSPNGFIVTHLTTELTSAASWTFDARAWSIVAAMTLSGLLISTWRLQSGFARK